MRRFFALFVVLMMVTTSAMATPRCATPSEYESLQARAAQSHLMVSALSCNLKPHYNETITRFKQDISTYAKIMRGHFARIHGPQAEQKMTTFVTQLANQASGASLSASYEKYCAAARNMFAKIKDASQKSFVHVASLVKSEVPGVQKCDAIQTAQIEAALSSDLK